METKAMGIPGDCTFLPIAAGDLLVSRDHAAFCRVPSREVDIVRAVVAGRKPVDALGGELLENLDRHGFLGPPRPVKSPQPTVQLQLTNACNLACRYCCTNSGRPRDGEVCYEQMLALVRQIPEAVGPDADVAILGGEPLLVPWALDLASEIVAIGLDLTIFTNGIPLADADRARRTAMLMRRGVKVRVSLAGPSSESCDSLSGTSRFDAALLGLQRLAAFGGCATVDVMLAPQQVDAMARELPALRRRLPPGTPLALGVLYRSGRENGEHLFAGLDALEAALDRIAFEAGQTIPAVGASPVADRREGCDCALGNHIHVRSDGALFNCFKMEEKIGHLDTLGFAAAAKLLRENPHRAVDLPLCAACPLATLCGAGCRSENLLYTGDPDQPPCGPWRVRVLSELLAEDRVAAVEWPVAFLLNEARARGIQTPPGLLPQTTSRHLIDV
jgi:radical SAM protein with 4Fe4S-binding SPASM domain